MRSSRTLHVLALATAGLLTLANRCGGGGSGGGGPGGDKIVTPEEAGARGGRGEAPASKNPNAVGNAAVTPTDTPRGPGYGRDDGTGGAHAVGEREGGPLEGGGVPGGPGH